MTEHHPAGRELVPLAIVARQAEARWWLAQGRPTRGQESGCYAAIAEAVAAEARRIDRAKLERRRDAYRARADANPNAYWLDLASAFDEALAILEEEA